MAFSSAYEDFCLRTLAALVGAWQRLQHMAEMRASDGRYRHWGLSRTFGDAAAQRALAQAHTELFLQVLRMPLRSLAGEASTTQMSELASYLPGNLEGGIPEHFSSIVSALQALDEARRASPPPGASPPRSPAR